MDTACLKYCLTDDERQAFEEQGLLVVKQALPADMVERLITAVDCVAPEARASSVGRTVDGPWQSRSGPLNVLDVIGKDDLFLELIDWPRTFPKVWGILGSHIQLYHSHVIVTPPMAPDRVPKPRLGWHQDSGRLNLELEGDPHPRVSLKVGFFLTDATSSDRGNLHVIPGSHKTNRPEFPADENEEHPEATPICVDAGDAVLFDRRLWHAAGHNRSNVTRKAMFYGYSYRWLKPRDDMTVAHYMERADPIRRQLLGASPTGGFGFTSPSDEDVPLKAWVAEYVGEEAMVP